MAEDIKEEKKESEGGDKKVCAYKLVAALGDNAAGSVIHVPEEVGDELVKAGIASLASEEDMAGDVPAEEEPSEPMVANSIAKLTKKVEKALAESVAKVAGKVRPVAAVPTMPAVAKGGPVYKSPGAYIKGIMKATLGDKTEANKVMAYQQEAAQVYKSMGYSDIVVKAPLGINEGTNASGGYLVNPQFSPDVYVIPHGQIDLQAQCEQINAEGNVYNQKFINESGLANGSIFGGLNMVATTEGSAFTASLPAWSNVTFTLAKLAIFNYYTTEVIQDASYPLESELNQYVDKAFNYGVNTQIVQGSTIEGLLNAPSLVTVTKSSNDTTFTANPSTNLTYADLSNMWSAVYPDCQTSPKGMWLFHPSLATALNQMTYTFSGGNPAWGIQYSAENGLSGQGPTTPYRIFGKPAYPSWACSAPGSAGDILYVDFGTVIAYKKPFRVEVSKDFQFGTDQVAVRYVWRGDIKTRFRNKVLGVSGTQQFGPIVTRTATGS